MIYAKNISDNVVKVAISKWSSDEGDDEYIDIPPGEVAQWGRSDKRGYLMSLARKDSATMLYSIKSNGYIIIYTSYVENNGSRIDSLYSIPAV
ncbi:hypothetical protein GPY51_07830 [Photorhabdus laumondii subsp. laumondii]|uniref:Photorhabdus luminescens subsp. laumondii TTO1 complete genome segment 1/17 n=4 Tax=Photorhabdus TaxID=29487 RepID=Q7N9Q6_PHOLL|nr:MULTISPECIES: hypothetical protein [Photorhabdus]AWK40246.1 hypothetical protein A4R40_01260 [Photorhabdus laumondii subsp. laumondii]AXG41081.1 hypothetical protein PluDJC_01375 [Photorhabdus laumondii subsp. laumondii]AXG45594.1 hypothetical protein PluTT01m_01325 [Photorhabdus laumondii subsp. laumondii]KTL62571.1 hypothetical protein AA106_20000 [Photorhabdus laumondii subsp. laumondii]MCC8373019.1 hypothetical protein [Photorhabdus bodei]